MIAEFVYTNHKNETRQRRVSVQAIEWLDNDTIREYGYERGLFLTGFDFDKEAQRSFSVKRIVPIAGKEVILDLREIIQLEGINEFIQKVRDLVDSVNHDERGSAIGRFQDGNGGLISERTLSLASDLEALMRETK